MTQSSIVNSYSLEAVLPAIIENHPQHWYTVTQQQNLQDLISLGTRLDVPAADLNLAPRDAPLLAGLPLRDTLMYALLKIRDKQGRLRPLHPNPAQRDYSRRAGKRNIVLKARQLGMTTYIAARFFLQTITRPGTLSVQVAHDQQAAEAIFRIVHRFLENLPEWLRKGALETSRANVRQIVFPRLDSEYRVESAADPEAGRGLTIQNLHCSEVARWPRHPAETLAALRAAVPGDGEMVMESTPSGAGGCFYDEWQMAEETGCVRHFFPWWIESGYSRPSYGVELAPTEEERELQEHHGLHDGQLRFRREIRAQLRGQAAQEFAEDPESSFLASGECVFDSAAIEERLRALREPFSTSDSGRLLTWFPPQRGHDYLLGVDPAGGGCDGDFSAIQVIDLANALQCAELKGHVPPEELARRAAQLAREYGGACIAVERNNHGLAVLSELKTSEKYPHLYQMSDHRDGWLTTTQTRPQMITQLGNLIAESPESINSRRLLMECRTFVRHRDGTAAAASGAHDDCVMAMAVALGARADATGCRSRSRNPRDELLPLRE